jgi:hypothetical protein
MKLPPSRDSYYIVDFNVQSLRDFLPQALITNKSRPAGLECTTIGCISIKIKNKYSISKKDLAHFAKLMVNRNKILSVFEKDCLYLRVKSL